MIAICVGFPYWVDISILIFVIAGLIALVVAIGTVGFRAYQAGQSNPVDAIRYE